jgi:hypothetical protein
MEIKMFFFTNYTTASILVAIAALFGLILVNELTRRSKWVSIAVYILLPILLTIFVWRTGDGSSSSSTWFAWVKTYSALAGVIGFMAIRYIPRLQTNKIALAFPAFILGFNILEAVYREVEVFLSGNIVEGGLTIIGGPWNLLNAVAGIITIVTMTGWLGIKVAKTKSQDMIWPDQLWFWIIAYDLWNVAYCYNCLSTRSFYAGFILLLACTLPTFFIKRGAWLQHRAQTLAMWGMFSLTFAYGSSPLFGIATTNNPAAMYTISIIALLFNLGVLGYVIYKARKTKRNFIKEDIFTDLKVYKQALQENNLA